MSTHIRLILSFILVVWVMPNIANAAPAPAAKSATATWMEVWNPQAKKWERVIDGAERFVAPKVRTKTPAIASFGPFRVVGETRAELVGSTGANSPAEFAAMLRAFPNIKLLSLVEVPGTSDDRGNLAVGRMIRARGITTHVPAHGSVRSGGVELFLAGKSRRIDEGAEFAVHSWRDTLGREAHDFAADAPVNKSYISYYQEMGMNEKEAKAFYDMTNSVPNASAKWLEAQEMRSWLPEYKNAGVVVAAKSEAKGSAKAKTPPLANLLARSGQPKTAPKLALR